MPTPEALDIAALLEPIPGDNPAGGSVPFALRERLDQARKEIDPNAYSAKDPLRPAEAKLADWAGIISATTEALQSTSKDLTLVARLIEAETKRRGFAGLRDSCRLTRRLVEDAWDRLRPEIEEPDDLEVRAAAFNWLDDTDRGARFPNAIRLAPLIVSPLGTYTWIDWNKSRTDPKASEAIDKAVKAATREACQIVADDLDETIAELGLLLMMLDQKMGAAAPSLAQIRQATHDCQTLAAQVLALKGPAPVVASATAEEAENDMENAPESGSESAPSRRNGQVTTSQIVATRAQAYQRLVELADSLQAIEPHSPIPHVIRRAVELGQLSFPELMKVLISDVAVLSDMSRNLGIKELKDQPPK